MAVSALLPVFKECVDGLGADWMLVGTIVKIEWDNVGNGYRPKEDRQITRHRCVHEFKEVLVHLGLELWIDVNGINWDSIEFCHVVFPSEQPPIGELNAVV